MPQYFEDNKLNPKGVWPGVWRMALVFACAIAAFLATNGFWPSVPLSLRFVTAALFGVLQVRMIRMCVLYARVAFIVACVRSIFFFAFNL